MPMLLSSSPSGGCQRLGRELSRPPVCTTQWRRSAIRMVRGPSPERAATARLRRLGPFARRRPAVSSRPKAVGRYRRARGFFIAMDGGFPTETPFSAIVFAKFGEVSQSGRLQRECQSNRRHKILPHTLQVRLIYPSMTQAISFAASPCCVPVSFAI